MWFNVYAVGFNLIPLARYVRLRFGNRGIRERNFRRRVYWGEEIRGVWKRKYTIVEDYRRKYVWKKNHIIFTSDDDGWEKEKIRREKEEEDEFRRRIKKSNV
jgi:hypothetical protein